MHRTVWEAACKVAQKISSQIVPFDRKLNSAEFVGQVTDLINAQTFTPETFEFQFPASLSSSQRSDVHYAAAALGIAHESHGFGNSRYVTVSNRAVLLELSQPQQEHMFLWEVFTIRGACIYLQGPLVDLVASLERQSLNNVLEPLIIANSLSLVPLSYLECRHERDGLYHHITIVSGASLSALPSSPLASTSTSSVASTQSVETLSSELAEVAVSPARKPKYRKKETTSDSKSSSEVETPSKSSKPTERIAQMLEQLRIDLASAADQTTWTDLGLGALFEPSDDPRNCHIIVKPTSIDPPARAESASPQDEAKSSGKSRGGKKAKASASPCSAHTNESFFKVIDFPWISQWLQTNQCVCFFPLGLVFGLISNLFFLPSDCTINICISQSVSANLTSTTNRNALLWCHLSSFNKSIAVFDIIGHWFELKGDSFRFHRFDMWNQDCFNEIRRRGQCGQCKRSIIIDAFGKSCVIVAIEDEMAASEDVTHWGWKNKK